MRADEWPQSGAIVDFGLNSQKHYEALYYPVRNGEIRIEMLDAALGSGATLTALARTAPSDPHKDIEFHTDWDNLRPEPEHGGWAKPRAMTPSEIAEDHGPSPAVERNGGQERER